MIWNEQVKDWLIKNMNEYRNTNGRLSINKMQEGIESEFSQPMDESEFIKWTDVNKVKQCDGIKRLKHRLAKKEKGSVKRKKMIHTLAEQITTRPSERKPVIAFTRNKKMVINPGFLKTEPIDQPTTSNLETLNYNGKLWISLQDCLKLLNIHSS